MKEVNIEKQSWLPGAEDWCKSEGVDSLSSDYGFFENLEQQPGPEYGLLDDIQFVVSPPLQTCKEEITECGKIPSPDPDVESKKEKGHSVSLAALKLLNNYGSGIQWLNEKRTVESNSNTACTEVAKQGLSTEEIIRVAGARFIQFSSQAANFPSMLSHPFEGSFLDLTNGEIRDVELVEFLLASAEKVECQQFERASKLLNHCYCLSSNTGNPVQRLVYYFSEALREKINRETAGRFTSKDFGKNQSFDVDEAMRTLNPTKLAFHREIPFAQLAQFSGVQAIVENVSEAKKIHIIDLEIRNGMQWTILMQSLASRNDCPLELLKISAVGTTSRHLIESTCKWLLSFAQTLNLPFFFKIVMVSDMVDLKEDHFELDADETVAVYSYYALRTMLSKPNHLESLMRVIKNIIPCVMVVTEVEGNLNSPAFVNRFIEALFFFGAYFDCLEACMKRDDVNRTTAESLYFGHGIENILAADGEERKTRHVKIDVWRAFFSRFGLVEAELSTASLFQAKLVLNNFSCGSSCTLDMNGKCLLIGWKGTPLESLSLWKFLS
ncbi:hypothetical protein FNV43_RR00993 [Rhamnella rubrinervis]|uniref:DELLA protein RGL1 n=1 Tax=Rhamnella rubrinervis TaxID=2594499 RepID=A0A8K0HRP0_9ROSA|nr:hypothetical protein FNV43_RR00993 [Rhamnella rubrinervis]